MIQNWDLLRLGAQDVSPLRVTLEIGSALQAQDTISITFGTQFTRTSNALPLCTIRNANNFGAPVLTMCSYSSTNRAFTLTLLSGLPTGSYLIEITDLQSNLAISGISFQSKMNLQVQIRTRTGTLVSQDLTYLAPQPSNFS